jgi:hypothetical protein
MSAYASGSNECAVRLRRSGADRGWGRSRSPRSTSSYRRPERYRVEDDGGGVTRFIFNVRFPVEMQQAMYKLTLPLLPVLLGVGMVVNALRAI